MSGVTCPASGALALLSPPMVSPAVSGLVQYCMPTFVEYVMFEQSRASAGEMRATSWAFAFIMTALIVYLERVEAPVARALGLNSSVNSRVGYSAARQYV